MGILSVVLITRRTERRLEEVLKSVSFADEIVVVIDTKERNSDSEKIGKKYKAKVFFRVLDDFSSQKNFGIVSSSGDWVLSIDADEIVSKNLQREIYDAVRDGHFNGYFIPIKNFIGKKWLRFGGLYPDYHLRLFKRGEGKFVGHVHEKVNLNKNISYLSNPLLHYTYKNLADYRRKVISYAVKEANLAVESSSINGWLSWVKIPVRFVKLYIFKLGFLDGVYGLASAYLLSYYLWVKFTRISQLRKK